MNYINFSTQTIENHFSSFASTFPQNGGKVANYGIKIFYQIPSYMQGNLPLAIGIIGCANALFFSSMLFLTDQLNDYAKRKIDSPEIKEVFNHIILNGVMGVSAFGFNLWLSKTTQYSLSSKVLLAISISFIALRILCMASSSLRSSQKKKFNNLKIAIREYTNLCREQNEEQKEINTALGHLNQEGSDLLKEYETMTQGNEMPKKNNTDNHNSNDDPEIIKRKEAIEERSAIIKNALDNYPKLPENSRKWDAATIRAIFIERMEHHAQVKQALIQELKDYRALVDEFRESIKTLAVSLNPSMPSCSTPQV